MAKVNGVPGFTQFDKVNVLDTLLIKGVPVFAGRAQTIRHIRQASVAGDQLPAGLDDPLRVEFGPASGTIADPIMIDATGLVTANVSDIYSFFITLAFGREGNALVANLLASISINGVIDADREPVYVQVESANLVIPLEFAITLQLDAGDTLDVEIARDGSGANEGGLYSFQPSVALGWPLSPSARIFISSVVLAE